MCSPSSSSRTNCKYGIVEAFSAGMRDKPETVFGTVNTDILAATVPWYDGCMVGHTCVRT